MSATILESVSLPASPAVRASTRTLWTGRILTGLAVLFLTVDTAFKLFASQAAVEGTVQLGFAPHHLLVIGVIELVCLVLYLIPRTAPLGAVLWTGYFGGAIVTHMRLDNPLFSHTIFPIYIAALVWGGLYLRDARVRALLGRTR
jgi:hypothetical protein